MITLTDRAIHAVKCFIDCSDRPVAGLRILIRGGGCAGFRYGFRLEENIGGDDWVMEYGGLKILVDPMSRGLLDGVKVDFLESLEGVGFQFENPNVFSRCACGHTLSA